MTPINTRLGTRDFWQLVGNFPQINLSSPPSFPHPSGGGTAVPNHAHPASHAPLSTRFRGTVFWFIAIRILD